LIGDFQDWCRTIDGILKDAGIDGFQKNRTIIKALDVHAEELADFLEALYRVTNGNPFTAKEFAGYLKRDVGTHLPAESYDAVRKEADSGNFQDMARWLSSRSEQVRGQYKLNDLGKKEKGKYILMTATSVILYHGDVVATYTKDQFAAVCRSFTVK
jgi:hypothetical protein